MSDLQTSKPNSQAAPPICGVISIGLPICALGAALVLVARASKEAGGAMAEPGILIGGMIAVGASGLLGSAAAIRAMMRKEKCLTFAQVGLVLNVILLAIGCRVLVSFHH
jgi:hypothetical protein